MSLRPHRRNLAVWSQSVGPVGRCGTRTVTRAARTRRVRRGFRTGAQLAVIGLIRLARAVRTYWRPLLAGGALTVGGFMQRSAGNVVFLPGVLLFLLLVLLTPSSSEAVSTQRSEPRRELARILHPGPVARSLTRSWVCAGYTRDDLGGRTGPERQQRR
jgi:hypothetical protein